MSKKDEAGTTGEKTPRKEPTHVSARRIVANVRSCNRLLARITDLEIGSGSPQDWMDARAALTQAKALIEKLNVVDSKIAKAFKQ